MPRGIFRAPTRTLNGANQDFGSWFECSVRPPATGCCTGKEAFSRQHPGEGTRAGRWEGNHRVSLSLRRQSACWESRRAGLLNYLIVWRDPSSEAERREHFVTERKNDKKSKGEEGKETLEELSDWILLIGWEVITSLHHCDVRNLWRTRDTQRWNMCLIRLKLN